ncbi:ABC-2 family transporter protein [Candidatus Roizmanbacteria bacterium]|nr:ABC-2 family transporter protein [Candidatus Roizmanbacteria bacterium]
MKKYFQLMNVTIAQIFSYRLSFTLWRARNIFNLLFTYFLWTSVFISKPSVFNYTQNQLVSYILCINFLSSLVLASLTIDVGSDILSGNIMNYLLKPFSFFKMIVSRDLADKFVNGFFSIAEIIILLFLFKPNVFIQKDFISYIVFLISLAIGIIIAFFISLSLSFFAFWVNEIWAPRYIYMLLVWSLAGNFFPLDILPKSIYTILLITPFPYLIYLPSKIFLTGFSPSILIPMGLSLIWCFILFFVTKKIWDLGIKNYSAYGR